MSLFEGYAEAYGTYNGTQLNSSKGGKLEIKATARTLRKKVTLDVWRDHLDGKQSLGIIPIRSDDTCLWGCIDIDIYDKSPQEILSALKRSDLPMVPARTKSGGMHLYIFSHDPIPANIMMTRLREYAVLLGYGNSEVFPKQDHVDTDRGDLGSWLNMPYFDSKKTERYGYKQNGAPMAAIEFALECKRLRQHASFFDKTHKKSMEKNPEFGEAPPCIQHLASFGLPEGTRNEGMFAFAIFAKRKYGDQWNQMLDKWNYDVCDPPLGANEIGSIARSLMVKSYNYPCKKQPCAAHCNSSVCRTRKYGVGGENDFPSIKNLQKLMTDPPIWFCDVSGKRLEMSTEQLQNYKEFHKLCMEEIYTCFRSMKTDAWYLVVAEAMQDCILIDAPKEAIREGIFAEIMEDFLVSRWTGSEPSDLLGGRPYYDEEEERYYFRLRDLETHMEKNKIKIPNRGSLMTRIKAMDGDKKFFNIKGKGVNAWYVPDTFQHPPEIALPKIEPPPM